MTTRCPAGPAISRDDALRLRDGLTVLVIRAGLAILAVDRGALGVEGKADGSPVTQADLAADRVIAAGLAALRPDIPVVSEESAGDATRLGGSFFLIDPLDGTKEFIAGRDEFTVNLALVMDGTPVLGIVSAPAKGLLWRGVVGAGAERLTLEPDGGVVETAPTEEGRLPSARSARPRPRSARDVHHRRPRRLPSRWRRSRRGMLPAGTGIRAGRPR